MGGGSLMTPILIIVFGFKPVTAVGTDLAYGAVTKTVGGWRHFRQHTVNTDVSTWMAFGSVPAAVLGVYVLHALHRTYGGSFDNVMITAVACALLFTGVAVLARALFLPRLVDREREDFVLERRHKVSAVLLGVFVGFVLGVTSAGSGSLIAVGLILIFRLAPQGRGPRRRDARARTQPRRGARRHAGDAQHHDAGAAVGAPPTGSAITRSWSARYRACGSEAAGPCSSRWRRCARGSASC